MSFAAAATRRAKNGGDLIDAILARHITDVDRSTCIGLGDRHPAAGHVEGVGGGARTRPSAPIPAPPAPMSFSSNRPGQRARLVIIKHQPDGVESMSITP